MSLFDLRWNDYSLDEDMVAVRDLFQDFFSSECPTSRVRAAEPLGYDAPLWRSLATIGVASMGLPEAAGGDGASLVTMSLVAEQFGGAAAPVPLIQQVVATRLLAMAASGAPAAAAAILKSAAVGERPVALALSPVVPGQRQLLPEGAIGTDVIALEGDMLLLFTSETPPAHVPNQGSTPLAWWSPTGADAQLVLAIGGHAVRLHADAVAEWKLLTAAALVGLTQTSLDIACAFVKTRETLGVPVGSLQGVAFPLADVAINLDGSRNLVRRAAWSWENDPQRRPELMQAAYVSAVRTATHGTTTSAHMQGGLGFTVEADASLYFLRSKGWSALGGGIDRDLTAIGDALLAARN